LPYFYQVSDRQYIRMDGIGSVSGVHVST